MEHLERTAFLLSSQQKAKLEQLAEKEHVSMAEIGRRAIDAYEPMTQVELAVLGQLMDILIKTCESTTDAIDKTNKAIEEMHSQLSHNKKKKLVVQ